MGVTIAGITWVVRERREKQGSEQSPRHLRLGILLAAASAVAQAVGMNVDEAGNWGLRPVAATTIRAVGAFPRLLPAGHRVSALAAECLPPVSTGARCWLCSRARWSDRCSV